MRSLTAVLALWLATTAWADVITLKNGRVINGTYVGGTAREVKIDVAGTLETVNVADIYRIEFTAGAPAEQPDSDRPHLKRAPGADADAAQPSPQPAAAPADGQALPPAPRPAAATNVALLKPGQEPTVSGRPSPPPPPVVLPEGTNFVVRLIDAVDSDKVAVGQAYNAALDEPVAVDGQTVIPAGADVVVKLVDARDSGKFTGRAELTLALWSVKVNGKVVDVNSQTITKQSESRGQKTGAMAAGGAIVGAVIGGIAGGGKGAAIGAGAGGAAGAGAEAVTKGPRVKIPAETRLTFVLDNAVTI